MKLHLLGIPHTQTHPRFSCCAFTGKVLRFGPMMADQGYHVIHYGNEGSEVDSRVEQVQVLTRGEFTALGGCEPGPDQYGAKADIGTPLYAQFNETLGDRLADRVEPGDAICLPFGRGHLAALRGAHAAKLAKAYWVETGIGYTEAFCDFRVYESAAWLHLHYGREGARVTQGRDYWWVIPNYYNPDDWPLVLDEEREKYVLFVGRLNHDKGLQIVVEIAKRRPDVTFVICGQGDPAPWITEKNIVYHPPIHGPGMAGLMGKAALLLAPTRYIEPFGGVAAEALLCGTPVAASAFGAFPEYIADELNGYLCRTLGDWLRAVDKRTRNDGPQLAASRIQGVARQRFSMFRVGEQYREAFMNIGNLSNGGWYHAD